MIRDECIANKEWSAALLRYFNPVGAHPSAILGEDPLGTPNNLLPYAAQVAIGIRPVLRIFGNDYTSRDGTPIRDYVHVVDLAKAHLVACERLLEENLGCKAWNIGTGQGSTVFEVVDALSVAVGSQIPYEVQERRPGDVLNLTANPELAEKELGWKATLTIQDARNDLWRFIEKNHRGMRAANMENSEKKMIENVM